MCNEKCSCTRRDCVKDSPSCGKMCFNGPVMTISESKSREISNRGKEYIIQTVLSLGLNVDMTEEELTEWLDKSLNSPRLPVFVEKGLEELFKERENQLTPEMNAIILDNLSDLYEE